MKECCGTCRWHEYDTYGQDYSCVNDDSENAGYYTGYNDTCDEWEGKDED